MSEDTPPQPSRREGVVVCEGLLGKNLLEISKIIKTKIAYANTYSLPSGGSGWVFRGPYMGFRGRQLCRGSAYV